MLVCVACVCPLGWGGEGGRCPVPLHVSGLCFGLAISLTCALPLANRHCTIWMLLRVLRREGGARPTSFASTLRPCLSFQNKTR